MNNLKKILNISWMYFKILNKAWKILKNLEYVFLHVIKHGYFLNINKHLRSCIKHEESSRIIKISFVFLNKTEKNHEQIFFNLTKLIYTHASGHVNFWDFKLVYL